jgi:uncharacterized membrane protein
VSGWTWAVVSLCVVHAGWFSYVHWDRFRGLGTFSYDVGLYDQGLWLLSRGHAPFVTLMGRNLFGDHASFVLILLVPIFWIIPGTPTLLVVQAMMVSAAALPIHHFAKQRLGSGAMGVLCAAVWLLNPAVNGTNLENFHPDAFLGLFVSLALFAAFNARWRMYAVAVLLCLLVKEDVMLVIIPLGAYVALRIDRRRGLLTVLAGLTATIIGMFLVMRSLTGVPTRNGWRIPFGGIAGLIRETFIRPMNVAKYLWSEHRPLYLAQLTVPLAGMFALSPLVALIVLPVLASNVLSTFWYQHSIQYHYSMVMIPVLIFASVLGLEKIHGRTRHTMAVLMLVLSTITWVGWGTHPLSLHPTRVITAGNPVAQAGRKIVSVVPDDAVVSVYDALTTQVTHRKEVYFFPNPFSALYYGVDSGLDGTRLPAADRVEYVVLPRILDPGLIAEWEKVKGEFVEFASDKYWQVFRRADR